MVLNTQYNLFDHAIRMASHAHAGQFRKGTDIPYISHPFAVAMILQQYHFPESWVIAGLLHDTIEDTELTIDTIRKHFGDEVAQIVQGCSEPEHRQQRWEDRKLHTLEYLRTAPFAVKVVSCADKLHNLNSIIVDLETEGEVIWHRFSRGKEKQSWYYRGLAESLPQNLSTSQQHEIFQIFRHSVGKVFSW